MWAALREHGATFQQCKETAIQSTVDFAFKKIFGSLENLTALIGLLNAILQLERPGERRIE